MQMDEVIRAVEKASEEDIQDLLKSVIGRYRELYPSWKILFISADENATDKQSREVLTVIDRFNQKYN